MRDLLRDLTLIASCVGLVVIFALGFYPFLGGTQ